MACKFEIREVAVEDIDTLAENMREADKVEVIATGYDPRSAVLLSLGYATKAWSAFFNDELGGIFGVSKMEDTLLTPRALVWFLSTPVIDKYPKTFYKHSLSVIHRLTKEYGTLFNVVDARYMQALNWLYRAGFEIDGTRGVKGPSGDPFVLVTRKPWEEV